MYIYSKPTCVQVSIVSGVCFLPNSPLLALIRPFSEYQSRKPSPCTRLSSMPRDSDVALL